MTIWNAQMILSSVIEETWNNARVQEWEHECKKADSAGSLEMLVKVRISLIFCEMEKLMTLRFCNLCYLLK